MTGIFAMTLTVTPIPLFKDNYAWLLRDDGTGATAVVDPADAGPVEAAIDAAGGRLDLILLTHHHADHVGGTDAVRARYGAKVVGAAADAHRLPKLDRAVRGGDTVGLGGAVGAVIDTPGHTLGHIAFHFPDGHALFCGDTLFSLGCGRFIEGTPAQMFASLKKLAALPPDTLVYCGHEYTESNARFAVTVEPGNAALLARSAEVGRLRAAGRFTVPSPLAEELAANPFMRAPTAERLGEIRAAKDRF
jgi:hydroxyacylglutathione hydrolase